MRNQSIQRDVYLRQDIKNAICAVRSANNSLASQLPDERVSSYQAGFEAALTAIAHAFNLTNELDNDYLFTVAADHHSEDRRKHLLIRDANAS